MEEIKSMLQAILEGQQKLSAELQGFRKETNERLDRMEERLTRVEKKQDTVTETLAFVTQDVYMLQKKTGGNR